jgi:site-specific recombinase XerD
MISRKKGSKAVAKPLPVEVDEKEFTALVDVTNKMHHKVAFLLAWGSGLRISEVINLKQGDIDETKRRIRVNMGKNSKDRIVPLPKGWKPHLMKYIPIPCKQRALQKAFITYATEAGIVAKKPKVHFHSLRHGFATNCIRNGMKLKHVQLLMGHADMQTTGIYIQLTPDEALDDYVDKF